MSKLTVAFEKKEKRIEWNNQVLAPVSNQAVDAEKPLIRKEA